MIYAISDQNGLWTILKGWQGCQAGQGDIIEVDVQEKDVERLIKHLQSFKKED